MQLEFDTTIFNNFIYFKTRMPYELKLNKEKYMFETNIELTDQLSKRQRKFRIQNKNVIVKDQVVPPSNSRFSEFNMATQRYSYSISELDIQLEIFEDEIECIKDYFSDTKKGTEILSRIFQNILLVFSQIYNESLAGTEFLKPVASHYGPFIAMFVLRENDNPKTHGMRITVSYVLSKINKQKILDLDIVKNQNFMWRYYFNKAKHSYDLFDNLDTILSSAISLESYIVNLLKTKQLENAVNDIKKQKGSVTFFDEVKIFEKNTIIDKQVSKRIRECFSKLKDNRNMIVHGDLDSTIISRKYAEESINTLIELYEQIAKDFIN